MLYLLKSPKSYYFRMKVPIDLQDVLKARGVKKSLKTMNQQRAGKMAFIYAAQWRETFESLRDGLYLHRRLETKQLKSIPPLKHHL